MSRLCGPIDEETQRNLLDRCHDNTLTMLCSLIFRGPKSMHNTPEPSKAVPINLNEKRCLEKFFRDLHVIGLIERVEEVDRD